MLFPLLVLVFGATAPSVAAGMLRLAVAALWFPGFFVLLRALSVAMAIPAAETSFGLLAVDSDVTETLSVVALPRPGLCSVGFDFYDLVVPPPTPTHTHTKALH
jgi:hypothetical protein